MKEIILKGLRGLEKEKDIEILFACESGSRAWGFHSPDSDYDVRFVYVHKKDWYLSIEDRKDFIDSPKDELLDIVGYDLRKMLKLFRGSNAMIFEWIQSPIMYIRNEEFLSGLNNLVAEYYSGKSGLHHYLGLTRNTLENHLQSDKVKLKKYFYALRPMMAAMWIMRYNECPPMEFAVLRSVFTNDQVNEKIDEFLKLKTIVGESYLIDPEPMLNLFVSEQMAICEQYARQLSVKRADADSLNLLFQRTSGFYDHSGIKR